jgi:hypothetical protein
LRVSPPHPTATLLSLSLSLSLSPPYPPPPPPHTHMHTYTHVSVQTHGSATQVGSRHPLNEDFSCSIEDLLTVCPGSADYVGPSNDKISVCVPPLHLLTSRTLYASVSHYEISVRVPPTQTHTQSHSALLSIAVRPSRVSAGKGAHPLPFQIKM